MIFTSLPITRLVLFVVVFIQSPLGAQTANNPEALYNEGLKQLKLERLNQAREIFSQLINLAPRFPEPYFQMGRIQLIQGSPAQAVGFLKKAVELKNSFAEAQHALGVAYLQQNLYREAETPLREAVRLTPRNPLPHLDLGHAYLNGDKRLEAIGEFEKVIALHPSNPSVTFAAHFNLGIALQKEVRKEDALSHFTIARQLVPSNVDAQLFLCELYFQLGKKAEAEKELKQLLLLALRENSLQPRVSRMLAENGRYEELVQLLESQQKRQPDSPALLRSLATAYFALGRLPAATRALEQVLTLEKGSASDYLTLAKLYSDQKDSRSIPALKRSLELQPDNEAAWETLNIELGKSSEAQADAVDLFRRYETLYPERAHPHLLLGTAYFNVGSLDEALKQFQKVLELDRNSSRALNALGSAYKFMGDLENAKSFCERALAANPNEVPAYIELGEINSLQGNHAEAIRLLQKAVELQPRLLESHLRLGKACLAAKQYSQSKAALEEAIRLNSNHPQAHFFLAKAYQALEDSTAADQAYRRFKELEKTEMEKPKTSGTDRALQR